MNRAIWRWSSFLCALTMTGVAQAAAPIEAIPAQRFRPAIGDGILDVYTGDVPAPLQLRTGVWVNYASRPTVIAGGGGALIRNRLDIDAVIAVVPFARVMFGIGIRATPFQDRDAALVPIYGAEWRLGRPPLHEQDWLGSRRVGTAV